MSPIVPGSEIVPGYRLETRIGAGQYGEVWRTAAPGGAMMALKVIDLARVQGIKELRGVLRVKSVRHPHLMPITGMWLLSHHGQVMDDRVLAAFESLAVSQQPEHGTVFVEHSVPAWLVVAMPLGDRDLNRRLLQLGGRGIPPAELLGYLHEAAKAIDFLNSPRHDFGHGPVAIRHGDIKPANMMLVGGSIQLCDFGLSKLIGNFDYSSTHTLGTPAYLPPECISGSGSHPQSDQYSLAISYCELRTGRLPFASLVYHEVLKIHLDGRLDLSLLSEPEREVVRGATQVDPTRRFESCQEFARALDRLHHSPTSKVQPPQPTTPQELFQRGEVHFQAGKYAEAIRDYTLALQQRFGIRSTS